MKYIVITLISIFFLLYCNSEGYKESKQYKEVIVIEKRVESVTKRRFLSFNPRFIFNPMFTYVEKVYIVKISNGLSYNVQETFYNNVKVGDKIYLHNGCLCYNKK